MGDLNVRVALDGASLDDDEVERLVRQLRSELLELDVSSVDPVPSGPAPDGAKGAGPVVIGSIIVGLTASGGVFTALVATLQDWLGRRARRHRITLTIDGDSIELEQATSSEREALIAAYIDRHSGGSRGA